MGLGVVGWYKEDSEESWNEIQFVAGKATVASLAQGTEICVRFNAKGNIKQITIPSDFVPATVVAYITMPLFAAASANDNDMARATKIGEVVLEVPRYQLSGEMDFSVSASGAASSSLSGMALAVLSNEGCAEGGYYARIKEVHIDGDWSDGLVRLAVSGAEKELSVGDTVALQVYGQYKDGSVGLVGNDKLTFVSDDASVSVDDDGIATAASAGTAHISISVTNKPNVDAFAKIVVSA